MKFNSTLLIVSTSLILVACGGGGGGGPSYVKPDTSLSTSNNPVPFATPTYVGSINPLPTAPNNTFLTAYTEMAVKDLTNTGSQNIVVTTMLNPRTPGYNTAGSTGTNWINGNIQIFGWQNGQLVNQSSQWFSPGDNSLMGPAYVRFGDFLGNGYQGFFVPTYTDLSGLSGPGYVFLNNGNGTLTRVTVDQNGAFAHDSIVTPFTSSGRPDIFTLDYGPNSVLNVNNGAGNFTKYTTTGLMEGGSSIAVGDFLNNGTKSIFVGDAWNQTGTNNQIFTYTLDNNSHVINLKSAVILPPGIFDTPAFSNVQVPGQTMTASIRALAFDFNASGLTSLVLMQSLGGGPTNPMSAVQFLRNNGNGTFTDVTGTTLVGWNYNNLASYNPQLIDVAGNGLLDIFLPVANGTGQSSILMQTANHQFVTSYVNVFSAFQSQTQAIQAVKGFVENSTSPMGLVQGPGNNYYLIDSVNYVGSNGTTQKAIYLSLLGTTTVTAQTTISAIKQTWPWMTDGQANATLAATSTSWFGLNIINPDAALSPIGALTIANRPISGIVAGINLNGADSQVTTVDQLGRTFMANLTPTHVTGWTNSFNMDTEHIDTHELTSHTEYLISGAVNTVGGIRAGSEGRNMYNTISPMDSSVGPTLGSIRNYTIGVPKLWTSGSWSGGVQYTTLNYSPWLAMTGSWGQVNNTSNFDTTVRYTKDGFTAVLGSTYTVTELTPGLINQVSDIIGLWGEAGYRHSDLGVYVGVKPVVVSGSVSANLPTGVDNVGNIQYTNKTLSLQNDTVGYVRALWSQNIGKNSFYRLSGTAMSNGGYRLMNEIRYYFE